MQIYTIYRYAIESVNKKNTLVYESVF